jgi:hypothetical protein
MGWTCQILRVVIETPFGKFLAINVHLWRLLVKSCLCWEGFLLKDLGGGNLFQVL